MTTAERAISLNGVRNLANIAMEAFVGHVQNPKEKTTIPFVRAALLLKGISKAHGICGIDQDAMLSACWYASAFDMRLLVEQTTVNLLAKDLNINLPTIDDLFNPDQYLNMSVEGPQFG